jgi:APA family basic amino acid/polyamine antiporter
VWAASLVATGSYEALFGRVIYTEWLFFAAMAIGLLVLRRRGVGGGYAPAWRLPAAVPLVLLFAAAALAVAVNQMVSRPLDSAIGLAIVATGIPVYLWWARRARRDPA